MIEPLVPKECFFTQGVGKHRNQLQSFELALRDAGIEMCNLVRVSSIFPPHCKLISKNAGLRKLQPGQVTYVVLAEESTNEPSRLVGGLDRAGLAGRRAPVRVHQRASRLRHDRAADAGFRRGHGGHDVGHDLGHRVRSRDRLRPAQGDLSHVGQDHQDPHCRRRPKATNWAFGRRSSPPRCSCSGRGNSDIKSGR